MDLIPGGENIEVKTCFYIGSLINIKDIGAQEYRRPMSMARGTVQNMMSTWKRRFLRSVVFPIVT